ncbi:putative membrane protein YdbT with pleckstrin-like domain [Nocardioides salarius]|uniref:Membrane protein YdbT with pleckstrin-like domain n=1 Tax=Nocardioides salarius TaxID=374513 RepID=A0ABS2MDT9_9ACTN|nr:PH domain-containing protein [Nocardioides salarius]MBM7509358.1 putative membrane protein YdbT with pleckstrin-like domain [Nocardioides salarius]
MPINRKLLNPGESVVVSTRTHPKALLLPLLVLVLLLALGAVVETRTSGDGGRVVAWVVWVVVGLGVLRFTVWPFLEWWTGHYTFTDRRLITRTGVLTRRGHDIGLGRVSDVAVELHLTDRLLGCGTLVISDASTHGQVVLPDIPRVEEVQRRLQVLLHHESGRDERA